MLREKGARQPMRVGYHSVIGMTFENESGITATVTIGNDMSSRKSLSQSVAVVRNMGCCETRRHVNKALASVSGRLW